MDTNRFCRPLRCSFGHGPTGETEITIGDFVFSESKVAPEDNVLPIDNPNYENITKLWESGAIHALDIFKPGTRERIGYYAYEVDGQEINIYGLHCKTPGYTDFLRAVDLLTQIICKRHSLHKARFHTVRAPVVSEAVKYGFRVSEIILRKNY